MNFENEVSRWSTLYVTALLLVISWVLGNQQYDGVADLFTRRYENALLIQIRSGNASKKDHGDFSIARQCELLGLARWSWYFSPACESPEDLELMRLIEEQYTETPYYGSRRMKIALKERGKEVNRKRVQRLMRRMGLEGICPKRKLSAPAPGHRIYPYLLRGLKIVRPNQVWSTDVTYIRLRGGFVYLVAIMDWYSRYVLSWEVSITLDSSFCVSALNWALRDAKPEIFNSDQGAQFTSEDFTRLLKAHEIKISMDGRGRALDNVFVERLWWSVKYEDVYIKEYRDVPEAITNLGNYRWRYNFRRPHQSLDYRTPAAVHFGMAKGTRRYEKLAMLQVKPRGDRRL